MTRFERLREQLTERQERLTEQLEDVRRSSFNRNYDEVCYAVQLNKELAETLTSLAEQLDDSAYETGFKHGEHEAREEIRDMI